MDELTERQAQILDQIVGFQRRTGMAPTRQELADALRISVPTVQQHLEALRRKGAVDWEEGKARSMRVVES